MATKEWVERIVVLGFPKNAKSVTTSEGVKLGFDYNQSDKVLTIKKPAANVAADFSFTITI